MLKILKSLLVILSVGTIATSATNAYFFNIKKSINNTFTAGTLELNLSGISSNTGIFNVEKMAPGDTKTGTWTLKNTGTIDGFLELQGVSVQNKELGCEAAEGGGVDLTCGDPGGGEGELQNVTNLLLFVDADNDGVFDGGERLIYNGVTGSASSMNQDLNIPFAADEQTYITAIFTWPPHAGSDDNVAQGDWMDFWVNFELAQTEAM